MPEAEGTKMNKLIVLSQSVQENRLVNRDIIAQRVRAIKERGRGWGSREEKVPVCLRESGRMAPPSLTVPLPCSVMGVRTQGTLAGSVSADSPWFCQREAKVTNWRKGNRKKSGYLFHFFSVLSCIFKIFINTHHDSISDLAGPRGPALAGWSQPWGSGNLFRLPLPPRSVSSCLLAMISGLPHCALVGGSVFPPPV